MTQPLLKVSDLSITLPTVSGTRQVVSGLNIVLERGQTLGLVGQSGSGKTLTAKAIAGLLPDSGSATGSITLAGQEILAQTEQNRRYRAGQLGFVFQNPTSALNPRLTIAKQLFEALPRDVQRDTAAAQQRILNLLKDVGIAGAEEKLSAYPHQLSGGQAQRVVIATALARDPQLLIADEPTTSLDVTVQAQILRLITELRDEHNFGVLLITHDMGILHDWSDFTAVLKDGQLVERGHTLELFNRPQHAETRELVRVARHETALSDAAPATDTTALLELRGIAKRYGRSPEYALNPSDVVVHAGRSLGIVGESGSGKTTLARIVAGLTRQSEGSIRVSGQDKPAGTRSARVQYVFQDPYTSLNPRQRIIDIVAEPLRANGHSRSAALHSAAVLLSDVGLPAEFHCRRPVSLSGGQRQRVGIARAVALKPEILISDEPVAALDSTTRELVLDLLDDLAQKHQITHLIISHDLTIVRRLCQDVLVLKEGNIVEYGTIAQVLEDPQHPYTQTLLAAIPGKGAPNPQWIPPQHSTPNESALI